ncbi:MAG: hypothetical protein HY700_03075 [Gemmatimonadetes bacterium]|nr:hypothetical protein [Gemmatimonadota bacterium]
MFAFDQRRRLILALLVLTAGVLFLSFLAQWFILTRLGAGPATDALFAALVVPQFLTGVVALPLVRVLVPLFAAQGEQGAAASSWTLCIVVSVAFTGIAAVLWLVTPWLARLLAPGFSRESRELMASLLRVQLAGLPFIGVGAVLRAVQNARHRFVQVSLSTMVGAISALVCLVLFLPIAGVLAAGWSFTVRAAVECGMLLVAWWPRVVREWQPQAIRQTWRRLGPLLVGTSYERSEFLLDRLLSTLAPAGSLSLLYLAQQLHGAFAQMLNRALVDPVIPQMAVLAHRGTWRAFRGISRRRLRGIAVVTGAAGIGLLLAGLPALDLIFGVRNVGREEVRVLWGLMLLLSGMLMGDPAGNLLANAFYAMGDTTTPTRIGVVAFTLSLGMKIGGFFWLGIAGLAAASSIQYLVRVAALGLALRSRIRTKHSDVAI